MHTAPAPSSSVGDLISCTREFSPGISHLTELYLGVNECMSGMCWYVWWEQCSHARLEIHQKLCWPFKSKALTGVTENVSFWWKMKSNSSVVMDSVLGEKACLWHWWLITYLTHMFSRYAAGCIYWISIIILLCIASNDCIFSSMVSSTCLTTVAENHYLKLDAFIALYITRYIGPPVLSVLCM